MQHLQAEWIGSLGGNEFPRRAQYRVGDGFRIAEVVPLPFRIRPSNISPSSVGHRARANADWSLKPLDRGSTIFYG
jgi:hypothetical protein